MLRSDYRERPAARCLLTDEISISGPIEKFETLRECFCHRFEDKYALHLALSPFTIYNGVCNAIVTFDVPVEASSMTFMMLRTPRSGGISGAKLGIGNGNNATRIAGMHDHQPGA